MGGRVLLVVSLAIPVGLCPFFASLSGDLLIVALLFIGVVCGAALRPLVRSFVVPVGVLPDGLAIVVIPLLVAGLLALTGVCPAFQVVASLGGSFLGVRAVGAFLLVVLVVPFPMVARLVGPMLARMLALTMLVGVLSVLSFLVPRTGPFGGLILVGGLLAVAALFVAREVVVLPVSLDAPVPLFLVVSSLWIALLSLSFVIVRVLVLPVLVVLVGVAVVCLILAPSVRQ